MSLHARPLTLDDPGEWAEVPLAPTELTHVRGAARNEWRVVLKLDRGEYRPWLLVGPSALLYGMGIEGRGLYTLREVRGPGRRGVTDSKGDALGTYTGTVIAGPFADNEAPDAVAAGSAAAYRGKEHLLWVKRPEGWLLVDGEEGGPPCLSRMNDSRTPRGVGNNVAFGESGVARATKRVPAADLVAAASLRDLAPSELLVGYGAWFWRLHDALGSSTTPMITDASAAETLPSLSRLSLAACTRRSARTRSASARSTLSSAGTRSAAP